MTKAVRKSLIDKNAKTPPRKTPYEHWQEIFTGNGSGEADNSERVKELVAKEINKKHARRDSK